MDKTTQTDDTLDKIAKHLAREIFKAGDDMHGPCVRITFRLGGHAKSSFGGGLIEPELANVIKESLAALIIKSLGK